MYGLYVKFSFKNITMILIGCICKYELFLGCNCKYKFSYGYQCKYKLYGGIYVNIHKNTKMNLTVYL